MEVLRAQEPVKRKQSFKPVYIKKLQEKCGKVKEPEIKESSIIYNRLHCNNGLHCTTPHYIDTL